MDRSTWSAPIWVSAFRPFYVLGTLYAPLLVAGGAGAFAGTVDLSAAGTALNLWHGHEMIYGFAAAIVIGTVLTALPSWGGTQEIHGRALAMLAGLWILGRIAFWAAPWLPPMATALADSPLIVVLCVMLVPQLMRVSNRWYWVLLPALGLLAAGNFIHHAGVLAGEGARASAGLRLGIYALALIYVLKGGVLTPIFTGNALRERGRGDQVPFHLGLEVLATGSIVVLAVLDLSEAPSLWIGLAAAVCAVVHAARTARWRGWRAADDALLLGMHLSFAWLVLAFALKAVAAWTGAVAETVWVHAFTVGSLGLMMLSLMTRVALRHTGHLVQVPVTVRVALAALLLAALLRIVATIPPLGPWAMALGAVLWAGAFAAYLVRFAPTLLAPSLPRDVESN